MARNKESVIDRHVAAEVPDTDKIRMLMAAREDSVGRWAINRALFPEQVHACLSGRRAYPEIRDMIAEFVGMSREELDAVLDAPAAA